MKTAELQPLKFIILLLAKLQKFCVSFMLLLPCLRSPNIGVFLVGLAEQKESRVLEGHMMTDLVHMLMDIPPKHSVSQVVGYMKGNNAIWIARVYRERRRYFSGQHMWARGYFVSTVGLDEEVIREYIKNQEDDDRRQDELFD